jgi:hypothetical protein
MKLNLVVRWQKKRMKIRLRAARELLRRGDPGGHFGVFNAMAATPLRVRNPRILGVSNYEYEICLRQKLIQRLISTGFLGELYIHAAFHGRPICAPIPPEWRALLASVGVKLRHTTSGLAWVATTLRVYIAGLRRTISLIRHAWRPPPPCNDKHNEIVLPGLAPGSVPTPGSMIGSRRDFVSWVAKRHAGSGLIRAHVPGAAPADIAAGITRVSEVFPSLNGIFSRIAFSAEALVSVLIATLSILTSRWSRAWLLADEVEARYAMRVLQPSTSYLFCNTEFQFRPLWTYFAAYIGSNIAVAFYSSNSLLLADLYDDQGNIRLQPNDYSMMNWPTYLVWNEHQLKTIEKNTKWPARFEVVGPPDFIDDDSDIPPADKCALTCAVFDTSAFRPIVVADLGMLDPYYSAANVNAFVRDIRDALSANGVIMYYKRKRPLKRMAATAYRKHVEFVSRCPGVILVDPKLSASRLISHCDFTISIPYTSAALVAANEGKPSVFYDPTCGLSLRSKLSHGILVLRGRVELFKWVAERISLRQHIDEVAL